ncbi:MAG: L-aspartate oxidase, partial [Gordonia sp. (in: high G+C Gram-positive bacteria)]
LAAAPVQDLRARRDHEDAALTLVASAVTAAALARTESRGAHSRVDHPETDDAQAVSTPFRLSAADGEPRLERAAGLAPGGLAL